ncbi:MAG: WD40 repeat domain-containing protein [Candidatus Sumerlaeia bacterium]|nr:WD40 repeat domain-containing protein [Candidatus Sumerlaeia bacterium]
MLLMLASAGCRRDFRFLLTCLATFVGQAMLPGAALGASPDEFEALADNGPGTFNFILASQSQSHTFHSTGDEDWIRFQVVQPGLPHTVRVTQLGADADVVLEIWIDGQPPTCGSSSYCIDEEGAGIGAEETWTSLDPPVGVHLIRIRNVGTTGDTAYTVSFSGDWGESLGIGNITRGRAKTAQSVIGGPARSSAPRPSSPRGRGGLFEPLYDRIKLSVPEGALSEDHFVTITTPWDILNPEAPGLPGTRPWSAAWPSRLAGLGLPATNATIKEIVFSNAENPATPPPATFAVPLELTLELENDASAYAGTVFVDDIPSSRSVSSADFYYWDGDSWELWAAAVSTDSPGRQATTTITTPTWIDFTSGGTATRAMIFAVVPTGPGPQPTPTPVPTPTPAASTLKPRVDGTLDAEHYGSPVAVQTTNTGFGDPISGQLVGGGGSELDALYLTSDGDMLYMFFAGNLETNHNKLLLFFDNPAAAGGYSGTFPGVAGGEEHFAPGNLGGTQLPAGFRATTILSVDFGPPNFRWTYNLLAPGLDAVDSHLWDFYDVTGPSFADVGLGLEVGLNNSNTQGVRSGYAFGWSQTGNPESVATGIELGVPLSMLGLPPAGSTIKLFAVISDPTCQGFSNQFLPGLPSPGPNLGGSQDIAGNGVTPLPFAIPETEPAEVSLPTQRAGGGFLAASEDDPLGRFVSSASAAGILLFHRATGTLVRTLTGHRKPVLNTRFSPDGQKLASVSRDGTIRIWDPLSGVQLLRIEDIPFAAYPSTLVSVDWMPDQSRIAYGNQKGEVVIADPSTGQKELRFQAAPSGTQVIEVRFSPDGTKLAVAAADGVCRVYETSNYLLERTLNAAIGTVNRVRFGPDSDKLLTAGQDGKAYLWSVASGIQLHAYPTEPTSIRAADFSPDGLLVAIGNERSDLSLYRTSDGSLVTFTHFLSPTDLGIPDAGPCWSSQFNSASTEVIVATGVNTTFRISTSGGTIMLYDSASAGDTGCQWLSDHRRLAVSEYDGTISIYDSIDGTRVRRVPYLGSSILDFVVSSDEQHVYSSLIDGQVVKWDFLTPSFEMAFTGHTGNVVDVALSPDGGRLATACPSDSTARIWDTQTGALLQTLPHGGPGVYCVAWSPDGQTLATGGGTEIETSAFSDNTISIWDSTTGSQLRFWVAGSQHVSGLAYSPDGSRLASAQDKTIKMWDPANGSLIVTMIGHDDDVSEVCFLGNGQRIVSGGGQFENNQSDFAARIWEVASGDLVAEYGAHNANITGLSFDAATGRLALASSDGTASIWDVAPPRAIIVAGGGPYDGNGIAEQTDELGAYAYQVLRARGYTAANILYLSAFGERDVDGDGISDVDGPSTVAELSDALTGSFAGEAGRLLVLMVDHGYTTEDFMAFRMNPSEGLTTTQMDTWLDDLQATSPVDVSLVVDCCYSGRFVDDCAKDAGNPTERKRIVISSTTRDSEAVFLPPPDLSSFMYTFLGSAYMGNSLGEAFRSADLFFQTFSVAQQRPQIDDGGAAGIDVANEEFFGATWAYGVQSTTDINQFFPAFDSVTPSGVQASAPVNLFARMLPGQTPLSVVATIRTPAPAVPTGDPVSNLPTIELVQNPGDPALWEATVDAEPFTIPGAYNISFVATFQNERLSNPRFATVTISSGTDPDATAIRALIAAGEGAGVLDNLAYQGIAALAKNIYEVRFQDNNGVPQPAWVRYRTPSTPTPVSAAEIVSSINTWAVSELPSDGRLFVHLAGDRAAAGELRLSAGDTLTAAQLDAALDSFQTARPAATAVVVLDTPGAGEWLTTLSAPGRVVILGSRAGDSGLYLWFAPFTSFSQRFLSSAYQGQPLRTAYRAGRNFFDTFLPGLVRPLLDDNGDGVADKNDGAVAGSLFLGRRYAFAGDDPSGLPFIVSARTPTPVIAAGASAIFEATLLEGVDPVRVYLTRRLPDGTLASPEEVDLTRVGATSVWQTATPITPAEPGQHILAFYAEYADGAETKLSDAAFASLTVVAAPAGSGSWMSYE